MLEFRQSDTSIALILTLKELTSIADANYLFVFTHILTKDVVAFVKTAGEDESLYQDRYNQYTVNPATLFAGKQIGEWNYAVYEQASAINTDPAQAGAAVEYGKLIIERQTDFSFTQFDTPTTYKTYNG